MPAPTLDELVRRRRSVLVFQEAQEGVIGEASALPALALAAAEVGLVANGVRLAAAARSAGVAVVHATAEAAPGGFGANRNARLFAGARAAGALDPASVRPVGALWAEGDVLLPRIHGLSPLTGGPLDALLRNEGVTTIVLAGVSLNVAIPNVVFDAVNRGYQVVVVGDAVAGTPVEYGRAVLAHTLALLATVAPTDDLVAAWTS
jgi:biuret amidohydrolase